MALQMSASDVLEVSPGIWSFEMPPHHVRLLGSTNHSIGAQSVVLLSACSYDAATQQLQFELDDAIPINIGTTSRVIGLAAQRREVSTTPSLTSEPVQSSFGPGDREFIQLAERELSAGMAKTSKALLRAVRSRSAGNLKRGNSRNFSETPDNFWYAIIQPRVDELSITVRGSTEHFSSVAKIEIKDDRGNTRFKVKGENDIPAALDLIFHSLRKR